MDCVLLCGGFAKRMWPLTRDTPKALLEVRGKPVIEHIMDSLPGDVERVFISTNKRFENLFRAWLEGYQARVLVKIVVEPSLSEGEKLGSIGAWGFLIKQEGLKGGLLSISGDNLFDFDLKPFLEFYQRVGGTAVGVFDVEKKDEARKFGIVELDENSRIKDFEEKPERPRGTLASTGIYIFPAGVLKMILQYLDEDNSPDAAGLFLKWLYKTRPVYGFVFQGEWSDIGSLETYEKLK